MEKRTVTAAVERMVIPTYCQPKAEDMPMYSEFRQHQGSTGYAYPNKVTISVEREVLTDKEYTVVRLENDFIRILILPELGERILEGYDKTTHYNFLYRHHRIKPVTVGSYGHWISGGMEWNFPFHHRPSTFMPSDFSVEERPDGSKICWVSEAAPSPGQYRLKGTVGICLRPDASYFETLVKLDNRTPIKHPFMWWENGAVHVNKDYQLFFPQDVNWVHHHNDRHHATFPIMKGWYAVENHPEETDISRHVNTIKGNSYFAGPSKYDFFGGYDHGKDCGTVHVADHHLTPGKKMFKWGLEDLGDAWNNNLTDTDGEHAELMAGSYANDQPDFTYIQPYEVKTFSQFWYPIHGVKLPVFANLSAAIAVDRDLQQVRDHFEYHVTGTPFDNYVKCIDRGVETTEEAAKCQVPDDRGFRTQTPYEAGLDTLVKECNYVMCKLGVDGKERLDYVLQHKPATLTDNLTWDIADAYSNVFDFDNALRMLRNHEFVAAECQETYLTEAYTFAMCCKGRLLARDGKLEKALQLFRDAQRVPQNFRAGWWDTQALYYAVWFEADTLMRLGRHDEALKTAQRLVPFIHSGYSPYMAPECDCYVARAMDMLGDKVNARKYLSECMMNWEKEISEPSFLNGSN
jgi:tetratricopeptide (TPR) repeat protein